MLYLSNEGRIITMLEIDRKQLLGEISGIFYGYSSAIVAPADIVTMSFLFQKLVEYFEELRDIFESLIRLTRLTFFDGLTHRKNVSVSYQSEKERFRSSLPSNYSIFTDIAAYTCLNNVQSSEYWTRTI